MQVRGTIILCSIDALDKLDGHINNAGLVVGKRDRFSNPLPTGYRDMVYYVIASQSECFISELQVNLQEMITAKQEGHVYYEELRTIEAT